MKNRKYLTKIELLSGGEGEREREGEGGRGKGEGREREGRGKGEGEGEERGKRRAFISLKNIGYRGCIEGKKHLPSLQNVLI